MLRSLEKVFTNTFDHICDLPALPEQIGDNAITFHDYASLAEGRYVTDSIVNWSLRLVSMEHNNPRVTVMSTEFYTKLVMVGTPYVDKRMVALAEKMEKLQTTNKIVQGIH